MQVGWAPDGGESTGHESGRIICELLQKGDDEYDDDDLKHMRKVISYVRRHEAQGPSKDVEHSKWRYSLMNWYADIHMQLPHCTCIPVLFHLCIHLAQTELSPQAHAHHMLSLAAVIGRVYCLFPSMQSVRHGSQGSCEFSALQASFMSSVLQSMAREILSSNSAGAMIL